MSLYTTTNWPLLRDQKAELMAVIDNGPHKLLDGLVGFIDAVQDVAAAAGFDVFEGVDDDLLPTRGPRISNPEAMADYVAEDAPAYDPDKDPGNYSDAERVELLQLATDAQHAFWDALNRLEVACGRDIDSTLDLNDFDLDSLGENQSACADCGSVFCDKDDCDGVPPQ